MTYGDRGYDDSDSGRRQSRRRPAEPGEAYPYEYNPPPGGTPFGQQPTDPYALYGWEQPEPDPDPYSPPAYEPPPATPGHEPAPRGRRRSSKGWLGALAGVLAVLLLLGFGIGAYFLIDEKKPAATAIPAPPPSAAPTAGDKGDISSQAVDSVPLTEAELFPTTTITVDGRAYTVQKTQSLTDCKLGTTGELGPVYAKLGCSQIVRATVFSPDKKFIATVGVFNFTDQAAATAAKGDTKTMLGTGKGAIAGWSVGEGTDVITMAETFLSWVPVGHYLAYCVLARADGKKPDPNDPAIQQVLADTAETYVKGQLKQRLG